MDLATLERIPNIVITEHRRPQRRWTKNGPIWVPELIGLDWNHNLRTNAGADWQKQQMSGANTDARATYIAVTANTGQAIDATQTVLTGEETANGLVRASGTFTPGAAGSTSYTLAKTFTYTGGVAITITRSAMFTASTGGVMVFFAAFGSTATLVNQDQLTVTWTINI